MGTEGIPGRPEAEGLQAPPKIGSSIHLSRKLQFGLPLVLLIPILALFGVFGEREATTHATSAALAMSVSYPERFHYRQVLSMHVSVRNISLRPLDTVTVSFDSAYIARFSSVKFEPDVNNAYSVDLTNLAPSESREVSVELWGQDYGRHRGWVVARAGADSVVVRVATFVFP